MLPVGRQIGAMGGLEVRKCPRLPIGNDCVDRRQGNRRDRGLTSPVAADRRMGPVG